MEQHTLGKRIPVFAWCQPREFFVEFHEVMAVGKTQGVADFQDSHIGVRQHEIGLVNFGLHYVSFQRHARYGTEHMGEIFFVVAEGTGDVRYPYVFLDMAFDIVQDILKHLPLGFGRCSQIELFEMLVMDFAHDQSGHIIDGQPVIAGADGILELFHKDNDFFRVQRLAILGNQQPDIVFRQITQGFRRTVIGNYKGDGMPGGEMHPVKTAVGGFEAAAEIKGGLAGRQKKGFAGVDGKILVLVRDIKRPFGYDKKFIIKQIGCLMDPIGRERFKFAGINIFKRFIDCKFISLQEPRPPF